MVPGTHSNYAHKSPDEHQRGFVVVVGYKKTSTADIRMNGKRRSFASLPKMHPTHNIVPFNIMSSLCTLYVLLQITGAGTSRAFSRLS